MKEIEIIDDERIIIKNNSNNPFKNRKEWLGGTKNKSENKYMSKLNYKKTIRRWQKKVYELSIDYKKCLALTLKFDNKIEWDDLIRKFNVFIRDLRKDLNEKVDYIRAVEVHKISKNFHIHLILVFEDYKPKLEIENLKKIWEYGKIFVEENIYNIYGFLEYLTLFKQGSYKDFKDSNFPNKAKIISTTLKTSKNIRNITITDEHFDFINNYYQSKDNGNMIRKTGHYFFDPETNKNCFAVDKYYLQSSKDFIYNNFGTKEDDEILQKLNKK